MTSRADIIAAARSMLDTPFVHQGRLPGVALDCAGLLACVADQLGLPSCGFTNYPRQPDPDTFRAMLREHMDPIDGIGQPGDALTFSFVVTHHIAIVTSVEPFTIIHAYEPHGKVFEHEVNAWWRKRSRDWYAFRGVS